MFIAVCRNEPYTRCEAWKNNNNIVRRQAPFYELPEEFGVTYAYMDCQRGWISPYGETSRVLFEIIL